MQTNEHAIVTLRDIENKAICSLVSSKIIYFSVLGNNFKLGYTGLVDDYKSENKYPLSMKESLYEAILNSHPNSKIVAYKNEKGDIVCCFDMFTVGSIHFLYDTNTPHTCIDGLKGISTPYTYIGGLKDISYKKFKCDSLPVTERERMVRDFEESRVDMEQRKLLKKEEEKLKKKEKKEEEEKIKCSKRVYFNQNSPILAVDLKEIIHMTVDDGKLHIRTDSNVVLKSELPEPNQLIKLFDDYLTFKNNDN